MIFGLVLVVAGSVAHAVWNLLVKRAGTPGLPFVWLYSALVTPVLAILLMGGPTGGGRIGGYWWAGVVSAGLHTLYAVVLQHSYARAELGVVYPTARAGAPMLVALGSIALLHTRPHPAFWAGIALIALGICLLAGSRSDREGNSASGIAWGSATAATIAGYTLWDGYSVSTWHVDVLDYLAIGSLAQFTVLSLALAMTGEFRLLPAVTRSSWKLALPIAALVPLSYGVVLAALNYLDVQAVAAVRSSSIVAASLLAWWILGEPRTRRRLAGAVITAIGVATAALTG